MTLKSTVFLLILMLAKNACGQAYATDTITLEAKEFYCNTYLSFTVNCAKPTGLNLIGKCYDTNQPIAYKIYKVVGTVEHLVYNNEIPNSTCRTLKTEPQSIHKTYTAKQLKEPGTYVIAIPFNGGELRSAPFKVTPFKQGFVYFVQHEKKNKFTPESYEHIGNAHISLRNDGTYDYMICYISVGEGTYTISEDKIEFKSIQSTNNGKMDIAGKYTYWFMNNKMVLSR